MSYRVLLESHARREFLDLPADVRRRIGEVMDDLAKHPRPPGAKKLVGEDGYRVRKGDYRVLYTVDDKEKTVRVYRLGHRREVYRKG